MPDFIDRTLRHETIDMMKAASDVMLNGELKDNSAEKMQTVLKNAGKAIGLAAEVMERDMKVMMAMAVVLENADAIIQAKAEKLKRGMDWERRLYLKYEASVDEFEKLITALTENDQQEAH